MVCALVYREIPGGQKDKIELFSLFLSHRAIVELCFDHTHKVMKTFVQSDKEELRSHPGQSHHSILRSLVNGPTFRFH